MDFIKQPFQQLFNFSDRTRRSDFWKFLGAIFVVNILLAMIMPIDFGLISGTLGFLLNIIFFVAVLSISVRRLHDIGRSGWWVLLAFTVIGLVLLLYFWVQDSEKLPNEYGPSPKYTSNEYNEFVQESQF